MGDDRIVVRLNVLSYNIHKGFSPGNRRFVLREIRDAVTPLHPDIVCLQEVLERHDLYAARLTEWPSVSQFEYLADTLWPHFAYGKNAIYDEGNHGNAILSKHPFKRQENIDVSTNRFERRGILHGVIPLPDHDRPLHVICLHLNLMESGRVRQVARLCERIASHVPPEDPLLVTGDFNDWQETVTEPLHRLAGLKEAFRKVHGTHARTFPSWLPALRLDRIYYRGLDPIGAHCLTGETWRGLSDHSPILAEFEL